MTPRPITVNGSESLHGAMELMAMKRIRHLPVVDAAGLLVGLVTDRDLRRAAPSPLFAGDRQDAMDHATVERVMVRSPTTVTAGQDLKEAVKLFIDKKYGALPVLESGQLVGILTPIDVLRTWLKSQP
jgi:acetoin utilization protein AcuB